MERHLFALIATLIAAAGCTQQPGPAASDAYVPHGRFAAAMPRDQAMRECRLQVESAGRQTSPSLGPGALRQIPPPPVSRPEYASIEACMGAKGYRRAAPSP
jgi:hypothetical protein